MPDIDTFSIFVLACAVLTITPGPAVLYIVTRSVSQGRTAGLVSCLGLTAGGMVHVLAAALGLSAVVATSALAFNTVKYAGAAYLVWLGLRKITGKTEIEPGGVDGNRPLFRIFKDAVVVNVLNPKAALFFLAFIPQFVAPSRGSVPLQCAVLGGVFVVVAFVTDVAWSLVASTAGGWLRRHPRFVSSERYVSGSVYLGLGLAAIVSGNGRK